MSHSLARSIPVLDRGNSVVWTVINGRFGAVTGEAARIPIGTPLEEVTASRPDLAALFARLLSGEHVHETMEWGGTLWQVQAGPIYDSGRIVGCSGVSYELRRSIEDRTPRPRKWVWELAGAIPGEPDYWSADRFYRREGRPGAIVTRWIPDGEMVRLLSMYEAQMHLISDSGPPTQDSKLRLLR